MSARSLLLADEAATRRVGEDLAGRVRPGDTLLLQGELGAGKTTLARAILAGLGLEGDAPSPSFALVLDYQPPEVRMPVLHVDLYRLDDAADLAELGLDDPEAGAVQLVEWPERAGADRWPDGLRLTLSREDEGRRLTCLVPPAWEGRWPPDPR